MRIGRLVVMVVTCVVGLSAPALPQVCGDANGNGTINLGDIAMMCTWLAMGDASGLTPNGRWDCDNRQGVTIADVEVITQYLIGENPTFDCVINNTYGFTPSLSDTVFLPYMNSIPDELDSVALPIMTSFAENTRAFYIPIWAHETEGPGLFSLTGAETVEDISFGYAGRAWPDTAALMGNETEPIGEPFTGRHSPFQLIFTRNQSGLANIACPDVVRSPTLRIAVEKNGDLYTPVVVYVEVPLPHPIVTTTPSPLAMAAKAGFWSTALYQVTFTSDLGPVSFKLAASDSWIVIDDLSPTGYTTPATITVQANASTLGVGDYAGQITFTDVTPAEAELLPAALDVTLAVTEPMMFPPGDLNCDGQVSIGDVALLIDCLFINTRPLEPCQQ